MRTQALAVAVLVLLAGCSNVNTSTPDGLSSFRVLVKGVYLTGTQTPAPVVTPCARKYGAEARVPADVRGTPGCRYAIINAALDIEVDITALDNKAKPMALDGPVSFRITPGDLDGDYATRFAVLTGGTGAGTVKVKHLSSDVHVWVEDGPVSPIYSPDGGLGGSLAELPAEPAHRTLATGLSALIAFENPTLGLVQTPDDASSRSDPFIGQFVTLGAPQDGVPAIQSCTDDPAHDGKPLQMVVTGVDATGFFVTDLTACRQKEVPVAHTVVEPGGYLPSTFGHIYVYNSAFPEGLNVGDLLGTLAGSVSEFTSSTQLGFASWTVAEHVRALPEAQWDKWLKQIPIVPVTNRMCGLDRTLTPFVNDALCAYSYSNLKPESLESGLVSLRNVKFPSVFKNCDLNADGKVEFFCPYQNIWQACFDTGGVDPLLEERTCNIDCTTGQNAYAGKVCSELNTYTTFGQFVVEMTPPGPAEAHLDDSIPQRTQSVAVTAVSAASATSYAAGAELAIWCTVGSRVHFGGSDVIATGTDTALEAKTLLRHTLVDSETNVAFLGAGADGSCSVSQNPRSRINVTTRDAVPGFNINCNESDPDAAAATQCKNLHGATYDVVGHLGQIAAARPRWNVTPRDADDLCCRPGPGLACPEPIAQCP